VSAFLDKTHGGLYWLVDSTGKVINDRKQFYNITFGLYGLSEHYRATGDKTSYELSLSLFDVLETYAFDKHAGGYIEACTYDWQSIDDLRLSENEPNCLKTMNTNLHILEAYTNLLKADKGNIPVKKALESLLIVLLEKIVNKNRQFSLFFDLNWNSLSKEISYGHDIEGSWLLYDAALVLENKELLSRVKQVALEIADVIYDKAIDKKNGGIVNDCDEHGKANENKGWWPQAEAVVGFYNAYELSGGQKYLDAADSIWSYIKNYFVDNKNGEWHHELNVDNKPNTERGKASFWKCPYHNARTCFELIERIPGT
jgi:mannobiose 2-epimerase